MGAPAVLNRRKIDEGVFLSFSVRLRHAFPKLDRDEGPAMPFTRRLLQVES